MERLWAPWRLKYVTHAADGDSSECVFCTALSPDAPPPSFLLFRGTRAFVILNKYPYSNGHVMVVLVRHVGYMADATPDELHELIALTRVAEMTLTEAYHAHGMNVGMNLGRSAGAGVLDHLHVHVVPRWDGDTNFMSVVGNTRVVPEEPEVSVERLKPIFARLVAESLAQFS